MAVQAELYVKLSMQQADLHQQQEALKLETKEKDTQVKRKGKLENVKAVLESAVKALKDQKAHVQSELASAEAAMHRQSEVRMPALRLVSTLYVHNCQLSVCCSAQS
jgi:hypothetical protein